MLAALLLFLVSALQASSDPVLLSDVRVHQETGDVIGTEVTLQLQPGSQITVSE